MKGKKTGGRKKGTPNKTPTEVKEMLNALFADNIDTIKADFAALSSRDRLAFCAKILPYIVPREVERLEVAQIVEQPLFGDFDDDQLDGDDQ